MTIQIKIYDNIEDFRNDTSMSGFRSSHQDFIGGKIRVTWVNGTDDKANIIRPARPLTQRAFIEELAAERNVSIT